MNFSLFIALRYFFARQSKTIIQIITWIAVLGLSVSTASMVIVLSAFNGIESIVHQLYSEFDPEISIEASQSKTFNESYFPWQELDKIEEIKSYSRLIEEVVVIKKRDKIAYATMIGAEKSFIEAINLNNHIDQGEQQDSLNGNQTVLGLGVLNRLDFYVFQDNPELIQVFAPMREAKIGAMGTPFKQQNFTVISGMNYNKEVNEQVMLVDFNQAQNLLNYKNDLTRVAIALKNPKDLDIVKDRLQEKLGAAFVVKTNLEKNELIFKTSKVEKIIVFVILIFIFVLSSFNMVASLTMMFIEKAKDMKTLRAIGMSEKVQFSIFLKLGLVVNFFGISIGLILGYAVVYGQKLGGFLKMPTAFGDTFPIEIQSLDFLLIVLLTSLVGLISAYFPVRYLTKKHQD